MLGTTRRRLAVAVLTVLAIAVTVIMYRRHRAGPAADGMAPGRKLGATLAPSWQKCTRSQQTYAPIWMDAGEWYATGGATVVDGGKIGDPINAEYCKAVCATAGDFCDAVVALPRTMPGRQGCAMYSRTVSPDPSVKAPNAPPGVALGVVGPKSANCPTGEYSNIPAESNRPIIGTETIYELPQLEGHEPVCETVCTNTAGCVGVRQETETRGPMLYADFYNGSVASKRIPRDGLTRQVCTPLTAATYHPNYYSNEPIVTRVG
jgi:hypothetical protein